MWLLAALFGLWCLVAFIEYAHWFMVTLPMDLATDVLRAKETKEKFQTLLTLQHTIDLAENMYEATSEFGCPYPALTRLKIAGALGAARKTILDQVGPNPFLDFSHARGSKWPFVDNEGKVKL